MRGVDDRVDALARQKRRQAVGPAKAADALGDRRRRGIRGRARERQHGVDVGLIGEAPRQRAGLARAAENEQAKAVQAKAP